MCMYVCMYYAVVGATDPVQPDDRGSFAFAGYAGANKPQWITQRRADKGQGPSEIFPKIALSAFLYHMYACHAFVQPQRISTSVLNETFGALSSNCI